MTGEPLVHRADDNADALQKRLSKFHTLTTPVYDYYRSKSLLTTINANQPVSKVAADIAAALKTN